MWGILMIYYNNREIFVYFCILNTCKKRFVCALFSKLGLCFLRLENIYDNVTKKKKNQIKRYYFQTDAFVPVLSQREVAGALVVICFHCLLLGSGRTSNCLFHSYIFVVLGNSQYK